MTFNKHIHHRQSIRLRAYDYTQGGMYFITICTLNKFLLFGHVMDGNMVLNDIGTIVEDEWKKINILRSNITLDAFVVMPNHVHGIMVVNEPVGAHCMRPNESNHEPSGRVQRAPTIGDIVRGYKSSVTKQIQQLKNDRETPVWQRNYYERIIRNENELAGIREYIASNPMQWELDEMYVL